MICTQRRMRLATVWLTLNLLFIWGNSMLPAPVSAAFSAWVKDLLALILPGMTPGGEGGHGLLRKLAHFTEFLSLGMCLCWLYGMKGKRSRPGTVVPVFCGALVACVDETIQCFVPGRGPSIRDVGIDTCGVAAGVFLLLIGYTVRKRNRASR